MDDDALPLYPQENKMQKTDNDSGSSALSSAPAAPAAPQAIIGPLPLIFGPDNVVTTCPHCQCAVRTSIKHTATTRTHLISVLWCFMCCCCCLPYCMTSTRNTDHYCPNCFKYLGTYQK